MRIPTDRGCFCCELDQNGINMTPLTVRSSAVLVELYPFGRYPKDESSSAIYVCLLRLGIVTQTLMNKSRTQAVLCPF